MLLTTKAYKKRSMQTLIFCTIAAAIVGSIQTTFIIKSINKEK